MLERIGRFEIKKEIGRGGMGAVYRAWDPELQREVAIKAMEFPPAAAGEDTESQRERFLREARTAARLAHPNIVAVHDVLREGDTAYIVMELIKGSSLEAKLRDKGPADVEFAGRVVREAAEALDYAHRNGVVHRDIKPANILLDETGRVKLADFGIARLIDAATASLNLTAPGATIGTLGYMAPEQIRGDPVDGRADQFSLGVVAYQMLTAKKPFDADTWIAVSHKIMNVPPEPPAKFNPAVKQEAADAMAKALAKMPEDRFQTCGEFARALRGEGAAAAAVGRKRSLVPIIAAAGLLIGLGTAGALWIHCCAVPPATEQTKQAATPGQAATVAGSKAATIPETKAAPASAAADPTPLTAAGVEFEFAAIPAGQFMMGHDAGYAERNEKPRHLVRITKPFYIGKTEVTRKQWQAVMGGAAPKADEAELPKGDLSFDMAQAFLNKLNARGDRFHYRLPAEAEWEYAARAGDRKELYGDLDQIAWYQNSRALGPIPVAQREPNAWGLHDVIGNVWEWCSDWYGEEYYGESSKDDPKGPAAGQFRILRGGSWNNQAMVLRLSYRAAAEPGSHIEEYGMRLVREAR